MFLHPSLAFTICIWISTLLNPTAKQNKKKTSKIEIKTFLMKNTINNKKGICEKTTHSAAAKEKKKRKTLYCVIYTFHQIATCFQYEFAVRILARLLIIIVGVLCSFLTSIFQSVYSLISIFFCPKKKIK